MNAVDTNILIYSHDPRDLRKQEIAIALIENLQDGVLLWQVACEYISASRKLHAFGLPVAKAQRNVELFREGWPLALPTWTVHQRAVTLFASQSLSWWDSLLVAACLEAGISRLYSEDMADGSRFESLVIVDPFHD